LQLNCNHFASDMCLQLTGKPAPPWVSMQHALDKGHSVSERSTRTLAVSVCMCGEPQLLLEACAVASQACTAFI
jgi:hypothetical protein